MVSFDFEAHARDNGNFTQVDFGYVMARLSEGLMDNWKDRCVIWQDDGDATYLAIAPSEPDTLFIWHNWDILRLSPEFPDGSRAIDLFMIRYDSQQELASLRHTGHELTSDSPAGEEFFQGLLMDSSLQEQLGLAAPTQEDGQLLIHGLAALFHLQDVYRDI